MTWHQRELSNLTTRDQFQARYTVIVVTIAKSISCWYVSNNIKEIGYKSVKKSRKKIRAALFKFYTSQRLHVLYWTESKMFHSLGYQHEDNQLHVLPFPVSPLKV